MLQRVLNLLGLALLVLDGESDVGDQRGQLFGLAFLRDLAQQQAEALPCLSSNNSTEAGQETQLLGSFCLSAQQKKSAALALRPTNLR